MCCTGVLPLASLRLMASPLQLTYSYIWQVIRQKNLKLYGKVEEFVTMVTQTVPELMSFKQTAQLILGLRARVRVVHASEKKNCWMRRTINAVSKYKISKCNWIKIKPISHPNPAESGVRFKHCSKTDSFSCTMPPSHWACDVTSPGF